MRTHQTASPDDIDLVSIGAAVRKSIPKILVSSLVLGGATFGILSMMLPKYTSQAQLEIIATGTRDVLNPSGGGGFETQVRMDKEAIGTHVRALMSTDLAIEIAKDLKLDERAEFNSELPSPDLFGSMLKTVGLGGPRPGETKQERVLAAYYKALRAFQIKETRGITVEFSASDSRFAADAANKIAEIYKDGLSTRTVVDTEEATARLKPQLAILTKEVAEAEAAVTRFRGKSDLFVGGKDKTGLSEQQLQDLTTDLSKAAYQRSEADARYSSARDMLSRGMGEALPDVQKSLLIPRLVEQRVRSERQIAELSASLLPAHPRMKQLVADLAGLKKQINVEVKTVVDGLEREAKISASREENIKKRVDDVKSRMVNTGSDDVRLAAFESTAKQKRNELERVQKQYEGARTNAAAQTTPAEVRIVSRALPSSEKAWPKASLITPLVMLFSALMGLAWTITRSMFTGARSAGTSNQAAPKPLVATPAQAPVERAALTRTPELAEPAPKAARRGAPEQPIERIAREIATRTEGQSGFRILVSGDVPATDVSVETIGLARGLLAAGRQVALVDWAGSKSNLVQLLKVASAPGLSELMSGAAAFEDVIQHAADTGIHVISSGAQSGSVDVDPERANLLLDALDEAYDCIIVSAPYEPAKVLFAAIQGRFDVGVLVVDSRRQSAVADEAQGSFLGFDVPDLDVLRCDRAADDSVTFAKRPSPARGVPLSETRA